MFFQSSLLPKSPNGSSVCVPMMSVTADTSSVEFSVSPTDGADVVVTSTTTGALVTSTAASVTTSTGADVVVVDVTPGRFRGRNRLTSNLAGDSLDVATVWI